MLSHSFLHIRSCYALKLEDLIAYQSLFAQNAITKLWLFCFW